MDKSQFLLQQFVTLRDEIKAIKARLFWIVVIGLFGVPIVAYLAQNSERHLSVLVPYLVLVVILMFMAEQNALMRAGRYLREQIEPHAGIDLPWEAWLESRPELRLMDKHFTVCFILVFIVYYALTIGSALQVLFGAAPNDISAKWWLYAAPVTYGVGAVWAVITLLLHWKSVTTTSAAR